MIQSPDPTRSLAAGKGRGRSRVIIAGPVHLLGPTFIKGPLKPAGK